MKWRFKPLRTNYYEFLAFLLSPILLLVRIMRLCADISELCDTMRFMVNYA